MITTIFCFPTTVEYVEIFELDIFLCCFCKLLFLFCVKKLYSFMQF